MVGLPNLSDRERGIAHRVLGPERLLRLDDLPAPAFPEDGIRVPLHEALLLLEYQTGWLDEPVLRVDDALDKLVKIDFSNGQQVGRRLGHAWDSLLAAVGDALNLAAFLENFGTNNEESVVDVARANLELTSLRALEVLEELADEYEGEEAQSDSAFGAVPEAGDESFDSEIAEVRHALKEVKEMEFAAPPSEEARQVALGGKSFTEGAPDNELAAAGAVQLRLICPPETIHPSMAPDYLVKALRLGCEAACPLLAHRTAWLTQTLIEDAFRANPEVAKGEFQRFFGREAGKIMSAGLRIEEHLTSFYRDEDRLAIFQAYRMLAEGVLRPYGQLVLRLEALVRERELAEWKPRLLLGDLVDAFAASGTELCRHLLRGTDTSVRNADAHADAVISASGEVLTTTEDGGQVSVSLREIETQFWLMRSALNGVDTADLVFHRGLVRADEIIQEHTEGSLTYMAQLVAREHMSTGSVERLRIDPRTVILTVSGHPEVSQVETTLRLLARFLTETITVGRAIDSGGHVLVEVVPLSGERPGRNDPCPCASGKKFKRCHGG